MPKTIVLITKYTVDISKKSLSRNFFIVQMSKKSFIAYFIGKYATNNHSYNNSYEILYNIKKENDLWTEILVSKTKRQLKY